MLKKTRAQRAVLVRRQGETVESWVEDAARNTPETTAGSDSGKPSLKKLTLEKLMSEKIQLNP